MKKLGKLILIGLIFVYCACGLISCGVDTLIQTTGIKNVIEHNEQIEKYIEEGF